MMESPVRSQQPLIVAISVLLLIIIVETIMIMTMTDGHFMFSLDDPYIHLALAENLFQGHYGVNLEEPSAPSSSILWPILISPLTLFLHADWAVLVLNTLFSCITLFVANKLIMCAEKSRGETISPAMKTLMLLAVIWVANMTGLVFTGMEHSLQVMLSLVILWGLVQYYNESLFPWPAWIAVMLFPLVRYEALSISGAALLTLFLLGERWRSVLAGVIIVFMLVSFSLFLKSQGLEYFPDSVLAKSDVAAYGANKIVITFKRNFYPPNTFKGILLSVMAIACLFMASRPVLSNKARVISLSLGIAMISHLFIGRIGWLFRYEIYIWTAGFAWLAYMFVSRGEIYQAYQKPLKRLTVAVLFVSVLEHTVAIGIVPIAGNNIYLQQYQMHKLVTDYYDKPVAVNDLGWPSYRNDNYVLDLWGLGSSEARKLRKAFEQERNKKEPVWMDELTQSSGVGMAMIYHQKAWFAKVPSNWVEVAVLSFDGIRIVSLFDVTIFATDQSEVEPIRLALKAWQKDLPKKTILEYKEPAR